MLKKDNWLSKQIRYPAYNFDTGYLTKYNLSNIDVSKYFITIKSKKKINKKFLKKNKIIFIEKNLTFVKKIVFTGKKPKKYNNIRFAKKEDKKSVISIAKRAFYQSRFFKDKNIKKKIAKKIKKNWVLNFFLKKRGNYLIVCDIKKKITGFLLIIKNKNNFIIDLIAVKKNYQKLGYASQMLNFFIGTQKRKKFFILASTQQTNKQSIIFYKRNKFKLKFSKYVYHLKN